MSKPLQPVPYLFFNGNCAEAMSFYEKALGGTIKAMTKYSDMPSGTENHIPPPAADLVMNAQLELPGGLLLYAGDAMPGMGTYEGVKGVMLALNFDTVEESEKMFHALSEGGQVTMPLAPTFWSKSFGMFTDKFGIEWCVNGEMLM
jgi:PhnB protein